MVHDNQREFFYSDTPLEKYEYMHITLADVPEKIIAKYNLCSIARNVRVAVKIRKGMYGLP